MLEHIICSHIHRHLESNNILSPLQHGFRRKHSCETQLLTTIHDLAQHYDKKTRVDLIILDFSKAFDTVPHQRLLAKLSHYGIDGPILNWIRTFLKPQSHRGPGASRYTPAWPPGRTGVHTVVRPGWTWMDRDVPWHTVDDRGAPGRRF